MIKKKLYFVDSIVVYKDYTSVSSLLQKKKNGPRKQTFMGCLIYVTLHYSELGITLRNSQIQKNN